MIEQFKLDIETLLNESQPRAILVWGHGCEPILREYQKQVGLLGKTCKIINIETPTELDNLNQKFDMGIIINMLEQTPRNQALPILARFRDLLTSRFCVVVRMGKEVNDIKTIWSQRDFYAIGMGLLNRYDKNTSEETQVYTYDIATYKNTPKWLNSDDWANPELWNKYRW